MLIIAVLCSTLEWDVPVVKKNEKWREFIHFFCESGDKERNERMVILRPKKDSFVHTSHMEMRVTARITAEMTENEIFFKKKS